MWVQIETDLDAPIAIVGIGCKVPGGATGNLLGKEALWKVSISQFASESNDKEDHRVARLTDMVLGY
jgi:hypothetical protein